MCLHPSKNKLPSSVVWKITTCWLFGGSSLSTNHGHRSASLHSTHTESGVFSCPYQLVLIQRVEERRPLFPLLSLAYYYSRLGQRVAPPSPITRWMYEGVLFPRYMKSDLIDKMKRSFFQAVVVSILLNGCTTLTLTKRMKENLTATIILLRATLNKSWKQHPTKQQLLGHLSLITKTIQVRWTRHAGHCWSSRDELISNVLLSTPSHARAKAGRPARTYIHQLSV